jgi:flagellar export protein FliJ
MKPFRFTLEALSFVRQRREQSALAEYGRALQAQLAARDRLLAVEWELSQAWERMRQAMAENARAGELAGIQGQCRRLEDRRTSCITTLEAAQRTLTTATDELTEARRQCELIEKLCQRQKQTHDRALRSEEQKQLDEIAGRQSPLAEMGSFNLRESWN